MTTLVSNVMSSVNLKIPQRIERLPITSYQRTIGFIIVMAWFFDTVDLGSMTFLLPVLTKEFHLTSIQAGLLGSMSFAGMLVGALTSGMLSDKIKDYRRSRGN